MNVADYLLRIHYQGELAVTPRGLFALHKTHLLHVPFENLDIHYGRAIKLDLERIYQKIVLEKRGGFCYELNGLFNALLQHLGFSSYLVSARVYVANDVYSPEYDHVAIIVELNDTLYLVDVGFGAFSLEPLRIDFTQAIIDPCGKFTFDYHPTGAIRVNQLVGGEVVPQYIFQLVPRQLADFTARCHFHQTSPDTHFRQKKLISLATTNGRITLNNEQLKIMDQGVESLVTFSEDQFAEKLKTYFNISL